MSAALRRVRLVRQREVNVDAAMEDAIKQAKADGATLRDIAEASGRSHEQVRRIVKRP